MSGSVMRKGLLFAAVFWTAITSVFVVFGAWSAFHQLRTLGFDSTPGKIVSIKVVTHGDSEGDTYGVEVSYDYAVGGRHYTGTRRRYGNMTSGDSFAARYVQAHPAGSEVMVYFSRVHPADAVLVKGLEGSDLFLPMFMTPFVVVGLGLWVGAFSRGRGLGGIRVMERAGGDVVTMRPSWSLVAAVGLATAAGVSFVLVFIVGFTQGFNASLQVMSMAWGLILLVTLAVMALTGWYQATGRRDVVFDTRARELRLVEKKRTLAFDAIQAVEVRRTQRRLSEDETTKYRVVVRQKAGGEVELPGGWWMQEQGSARLALVAATLIGCEAVGANGKVLTGTGGGHLSNLV